MAAKKGPSFESLMNDLKKGSYHPLYFLHGDESYFIDQLVTFCEEQILDESEKAFNLCVLYGRDCNHVTVIDQARRFPMMSPYQVVIVKEAQHMRDLADLEKYVASPSESTILVISYKNKKLDRRTKFAKAVAKHGIVFESKKLYANQVPGWINSYLSKRGYSIGPKDNQLISEYLGNDLSRITNELSKMMINLEGKLIDQSAIEKHIGISKDYNIFELQSALASRDASRSYRIIKYFIQNPKNHPMVLLLGGLYSYFSKIYILHGLGRVPDRAVMQALKLSSPYFVAEYRTAAKKYSRQQTEKVIRMLREYDLRSKGVDNDHFSHEDLLQEMIYRILAA